MNALVIYDSKFGNTERLAQTIGAVLKASFTVEVKPVMAKLVLPPDLELVVVGEPTHAHGLSQPMRTFLAQLRSNSLLNIPVLAFDTRFRMAPLLSGRAAPKIARALERSGAHLLLAPESFVVAREEGNPLEPGEEQRAATWVRATLAAYAIPA